MRIRINHKCILLSLLISAAVITIMGGVYYYTINKYPFVYSTLTHRTKKNNTIINILCNSTYCYLGTITNNTYCILESQYYYINTTAVKLYYYDPPPPYKCSFKDNIDYEYLVFVIGVILLTIIICAWIIYEMDYLA